MEYSLTKVGTPIPHNLVTLQGLVVVRHTHTPKSDSMSTNQINRTIYCYLPGYMGAMESRCKGNQIGVGEGRKERDCRPEANINCGGRRDSGTG